MAKRGRRGSIITKTPGSRPVMNASKREQHYGSYKFMPGESKSVPNDVADSLLALPAFVDPTGVGEKAGGEFITEFLRAFWSDAPMPPGIEAMDRASFRNRTDEFDPVPHAEEPFSVLFRMSDLRELHGGARVIGRLCHHLAMRGHDVKIFPSNSSIGSDDLQSIPIDVVSGYVETDFVVGTFWPTIYEVARMETDAVKIGLVQGDEPAWPTWSPEEANRAASAFGMPQVNYIPICEELAEKCRAYYGMQVLGSLPGNGVDPLDFSPRCGNIDKRNSVFFIHRSVWWKGTDVVMQIIDALKRRDPTLRVVGCGFSPFEHPEDIAMKQALVDDYEVLPSVARMAELYSNSDFYLCASLFEGSPLPPLEAMACGCIPVIPSIGTRDYAEDGRNAVIFSPSNCQGVLPTLVADRMIAMLHNESELVEMKRRCLGTAADRPWHVTASAFELLLLGLREPH